MCSWLIRHVCVTTLEFALNNELIPVCGLWIGLLLCLPRKLCHVLHRSWTWHQYWDVMCRSAENGSLLWYLFICQAVSNLFRCCYWVCLYKIGKAWFWFMQAGDGLLWYFPAADMHLVYSSLLAMSRADPQMWCIGLFALFSGLQLLLVVKSSQIHAGSNVVASCPGKISVACSILF